MQCAARIIDSGVLNDQLKKLVSVIYPIEEGAAALQRASADRLEQKIRAVSGL